MLFPRECATIHIRNMKTFRCRFMRRCPQTHHAVVVRIPERSRSKGLVSEVWPGSASIQELVSREKVERKDFALRPLRADGGASFQPAWRPGGGGGVFERVILMHTYKRYLGVYGLIIWRFRDERLIFLRKERKRLRQPGEDVGVSYKKATG